MTALNQRSFSSGEIAPSLYARADLVKYATGLRTCKNFVVARHGGVFNRPGTRYIADVKQYFYAPRLIPFVFNADQTYVLEFGNQYMRVIRNGSLVCETAKNIVGATKANPCEITISTHGFAENDEIVISGVGGMTELNGRTFVVKNAMTHTFTLETVYGQNVDATSYGAYTSGGTAARVYKLTTPYAIADVPTLQYVQSADVMTLVHSNYAPRELKRTGHASWSINSITFAPTIGTPDAPTLSGTAGSNSHDYVITAIAQNTYEESLPSDFDGNNFAGPSATNPVTLTWSAVTGATEYNIYRGQSNTWFYIGTSATTSFKDTGFQQDFTKTPPIARTPFGSAGNYPSSVSYYQQRRLFGGTNNNIETVWTSRSGLPANFTISSPLQDDDAITFTLSGRYVNGIRHMIEANKLVVLTSGGEWSIDGDAAGIIRPTDINAKQHAYNGASTLTPLVVNGTIVYVQARGSIVRDLGFDFAVDGYRGNDLTVFASHLFDKYTISDWAFQQIPHSIVWAIRSDGVLLGMTYLREHEILAWHRHEFSGIVESVCVVPEGTEDALYLAIKRGGLRTIERMTTRNFSNQVDAVFLDAALTYDGRNTSPSRTMELSGGFQWDNTEELTLTCSQSFFTTDDVGNAIHLTSSDGEIVRCRIMAYTSGTVVTVRPNKEVPTSLRTNATTNWAKAVDVVSGLWHLEGKQVGICADGVVVANPRNAAYKTYTVANGSVTLDLPYSVVHVGLPITADFETLDIDTTQGETMADKKKLVSKVVLFVESSSGIFVGAKPPTDDDVDPLEGLMEMKLRDTEEYDEPIDLETGPLEVNILSEWNNNGRIFVRQTDPVPLSILAAVPVGLFPVRG